MVVWTAIGQLQRPLMLFICISIITHILRHGDGTGQEYGYNEIASRVNWRITTLRFHVNSTLKPKSDSEKAEMDEV